LLDPLADARRLGRAVEETVVGDPIESLAEDRLAVDLQDELRADVVGRGLEFDGAEADAARTSCRTRPRAPISTRSRPRTRAGRHASRHRRSTLEVVADTPWRSHCCLHPRRGHAVARVVHQCLPNWS
jgi:hypothetical protein